MANRTVLLELAGLRTEGLVVRRAVEDVSLTDEHRATAYKSLCRLYAGSGYYDENEDPKKALRSVMPKLPEDERKIVSEALAAYERAAEAGAALAAAVDQFDLLRDRAKQALLRGDVKAAG